MLGMPSGSGDRPDTLRVAPGGLRERLTFGIDELVGRSVAASPGNRHFGSGGTALGRVDKAPLGKRLGPK